MTIVYYDYKPKRARKARPTVEFPYGRIVAARHGERRKMHKSGGPLVTAGEPK
jgi:hypothetical protein